VGRHTSDAFVAFLGAIVSQQPKSREIHVIVDNLATHKTQLVRTSLVEHPHVQLHFTPTYSSWLNQVELSFSKIERELLARGIFQLGARSGEANHAAHSQVQQTGQTDPVELSRSYAPNSSTSVRTVHESRSHAWPSCTTHVGCRWPRRISRENCSEFPSG
jgi:DDE superfamily endonuclease